MKKNSPYLVVYDIVLQIPKGRVLTYGQISNLLGGRLSAQGVGWALKALSSAALTNDPALKKYQINAVPWQRVVAFNGGMSTNKLGTLPPDHQKTLLALERVEFDEHGCVNMRKHLWLEGIEKIKL